MSAIDLNSEYEIESRVPDVEAVQARYVALSAAASELPDAHFDLAYGAEPRQALDVFSVGAGKAPALLFFHGGYWRAGSKETRRFAAAAWRARGVAWVPVGYRLAPDASLDDIVADARAAVAWFHANAERFGCDPEQLHVAGNSAGGHIVGMLAAEGWQGAVGLPGDAIKSVVAVSGLFDLAPLRETFVNDWLSLDAASAARNSPMGAPPRAGLPMLLAWGGHESDAFKAQSRDYAAACRTAGAEVTLLARDDADHLSIIGEFGQPESALFKAVAAQLGVA
ncbi:MAG: alpha/beta hydrolase [Alphaproteobacteria bacterium]|nr:alpha/beta hydrolase [Alphaproteobacteria bacterium]